MLPLSFATADLTAMVIDRLILFRTRRRLTKYAGKRNGSGFDPGWVL
jgi:hypothetical protein